MTDYPLICLLFPDYLCLVLGMYKKSCTFAI